MCVREAGQVRQRTVQQPEWVQASDSFEAIRINVRFDWRWCRQRHVVL